MKKKIYTFEKTILEAEGNETLADVIAAAGALVDKFASRTPGQVVGVEVGHPAWLGGASGEPLTAVVHFRLEDADDD